MVTTAPLVRRGFVQPSVLPGFGLTFGLTMAWLSIIVLVPLIALIIRPWEMGLDRFLELAARPRVVAALSLSFGTAALAAAINLVFGSIIATIENLLRFYEPALCQLACRLCARPAPILRGDS